MKKNERYSQPANACMIDSDLNEYNIKSCWSNLVELSFFAPHSEVISKFNNNWIYATDDEHECAKNGNKKSHHNRFIQYDLCRMSHFNWPCYFGTYCMRRTFCQYYNILLLLKLYHTILRRHKKWGRKGNKVIALSQPLWQQ